MLNPTLEEIAKAAQRLGYEWSYPAGIPSAEFLYLHDHSHKKFLVNKTKSPFLSSIQAKLVTDKYLSGQMMAEAGLPVAPKHISNEFSEADIAFLHEHREIIVKPNRMDRGVAVKDRITEEHDLRNAYQSAFRYGPVILEKQITGHEYRVLVINGKAVAALERKPLVLKGDGHSTIRDLIVSLNLDTRRGVAKDRKPLRPISLAADMGTKLKAIGLSFDYVLENGQPKQISFSNHLDSGGVASDCTDTAHSVNLKICEDAAQLFSIDVAGIDLICPDITKPISPMDGAAILEVNPGPDILWHMYPTEGKPQPVADMFVQYVCGSK